MDYTKVPRALIYRERRSLEEFGAYEENNITRPLTEELLKFQANFDLDLECFILSIINNAFYICTMILLERDPRLRIHQYKKIATQSNVSISILYWSTTLTIVILFLQRLEKSYKKSHPFVDETRGKLLLFITGDVDKQTEKIFNWLSKRLHSDTAIPKEIPCSMFASRIIDKEAVSDALSEENFNWPKFTNYWEERSLRDIVMALGKTEEEKYNVINVLSETANGFYYTKGFNPNIEEVKKKLNCIGEEIRGHFSPGGKKVLKETTNQEKQVDITPYENRIKELEKENKEQGKRIKEFEEFAKSTSKEIPWHDKVRLELALLFMENADCDMKKYGNKARAARVLQAITKLPISTCKNYVTNRDLNTQEHKEEILEINTELQALGTELRL